MAPARRHSHMLACPACIDSRTQKSKKKERKKEVIESTTSSCRSTGCTCVKVRVRVGALESQDCCACVVAGLGAAA